MAEALSHVRASFGPVVDEHRRVSRSRFPGQVISMRSFLPMKKVCRLGVSYSSSSDLYGRKLVLDRSVIKIQSSKAVSPKMSLTIGKAQKWWEKGLQSNMKEIQSAQDLVDSLQNAGDNLVVVDFFSPGCGGCKALHPKICQLAEMNTNVQFLQVNYEQHKSMCYSLGVHVLPFFRFYRGAAGRVTSFSCTNATIKKFKDALAKHNTERCSLGPAKGLEEKDLLALAANRELGFTYVPKPVPDTPESEPARKEVDPLINLPLPLPIAVSKPSEETEKSMALARQGRALVFGPEAARRGVW
ncbi:hypothetical protein V2J09_019358 [Rumex salicifolius]